MRTWALGLTLLAALATAGAGAAAPARKGSAWRYDKTYASS